jgi:hypothetical protein
MCDPEKFENKQAAESHFQSCMRCLKKLGETFWHASFYHDLFEIASQGLGTRSNSCPKRNIQSTGLQDTEFNGDRICILDPPLARVQDPGAEIPEEGRSSIGSERVLSNYDQSSSIVDSSIYEDESLQNWLDGYGLFHSLLPSP